MSVVGIDACKRGWIAFELLRVDVYAASASLDRMGVARVRTGRGGRGGRVAHDELHQAVMYVIDMWAARSRV